MQYAATIFGAGLYQFTKNWKHLQTKTNFGNRNVNEGFKNVRSIYKQNNFTWVASHAGLSKCDDQLNIIKHFTPTYSNPNIINPNMFNKILPLSDSLILIKGFMTLHKVTSK